MTDPFPDLVDHHVHFTGGIPSWLYDQAGTTERHPTGYDDFFETYAAKKRALAAWQVNPSALYRLGTAALLVESASNAVREVEVIAGFVIDGPTTAARIAAMGAGEALARRAAQALGLAEVPALKIRLTFIRARGMKGFGNVIDLDGIGELLATLDSRVFSLDISGPEGKGDLELELGLLAWLERVANQREVSGRSALQVSCHAGERIDVDASAALLRVESLAAAGITRFAHLNVLWSHEFLSRLGEPERALRRRVIDTLRSLGVSADICPTSSSVMTQVGMRFCQANVELLRQTHLPVTVGTDNPAILGTDLSTEYSILGMTSEPLPSPRPSSRQCRAAIIQSELGG